MHRLSCTLVSLCYSSERLLGGQSQCALSMAPQGWTTPDQLQFLQNHMDACCDVKAEGNMTHFHHKLYRNWFQAFPERAVLFPSLDSDLTLEQTVALGEAIRLRKNVSNVHHYHHKNTSY